MIKLLYGMEGTLQDILDQFPSELYPMIGEITIPDDNALKLSQSIVKGECIGASDSSLVREFNEVRGGFGYVLCQRASDAGSLHGIGISTLCDEMSSQTSEHQGLIGILCILHAICIKYLLVEEECWGEIIIYIDNKNVVERAAKEQEPYNISDYQAPDQDLWALTTTLLEALPIKVRCQWIRGHGDTNTNGERIFGPFLRSTQLNIWSDELALEGLWRSEMETIQKKPFHSTKVLLLTTDGRAVYNLRKYLLRSKNGEELLNYYREKKGWHSRIFNSIDWEALESLLKKAPPTQKNRLVQILHDWQNVGKQKGKLRDSRLSKKADPPLQATTEEESIHKCPMGCGEEEGPLHYVCCTSPGVILKREQLWKNTITRLQRLRTNEGICSYTSFILKK